jgi:hypothetical protein
MDYKKFKILLDSYYNGETSLEDEKLLQDFFSGNNISEELLEEKELFESYKKIRTESEPHSNLNDELINLIDQKWQESTKGKFKSAVKWSMSVAASIVIMFSVYFYYNQKPNTMQDTFADEQQAYTATKQVLTYISETMDSESVKLAGLTQINENFKSIDRLKNLDKAIKNYKSQGK